MTTPAAGPAAAVRRPLDAVLSRLQGVRQAGSGWTARCPAHDDRRNSLSIRETQDSKILLKCFGGCETAAIVQAVGLEMRDLFPDAGRRERPTRSNGRGSSTITLEALAADKALPPAFLRGLGLHDLPSGRGVGIPYRDEAGNTAHVKRRTALRAKDGSYWPKGAALMPYGLDRLEEARRAGYLVLVEGESDCWTLWHHGIPALGIPGASAYGTLEGRHLDGIGRVYVLQEPDAGGASLVAGIGRRLHEIGWGGQAFVVRLDGAKDPNDLHRRDPDGFRTAFQAALDRGEALKMEAPEDVAVLEAAPDMIRRPLCLVAGHAYAAAWLWIKRTIRQTTDAKGNVTVHNPPLIQEAQALAIIRDDSAMFSDAPLPGAKPLSDLGLTVSLPEIPPADRTWSGAGVKRFLAGERPDPADVFRRVRDVVDRYMDFRRSLAAQGTMCELVGCFILASYLLDAFNVIGYLWPNGERGAGKTNLLFTVTELAYLGAVILAGGSYASLRDLADYGATIAFDDCEAIMDPKRADPDKRTLLLAGNRRGATVTFKEPAGKRGWVTRHVHTYCPRLFSAIRLPDEVLASRTITIPLVRSGDDRRAKAAPLDHQAWPHDRRRLIDDLWAMALANLPVLRRFDEEAARRARLTGRDLEPWRAILAVALWLQEVHGVTGLFERMEALSVAYQAERGELEATDPTRLLILALRNMFAAKCHDADSAGSAVLVFDTSTVTETINKLAIELEVVDDGEHFTNARRVGRLLERLRFQKAQRTANRKRWKISRDELAALARTYGMEVVSPLQHGTNGRNGNMAQDEVPSCQVCQECQDVPDIPPPGDEDAPPALEAGEEAGDVWTL